MDENNYTNEKYPLSDLTAKIIKCAIEVHRHLGNGFQEVIYQRALAFEFNLQNIPFEREFEMPLFYKGEQIGESCGSTEVRVVRASLQVKP